MFKSLGILLGGIFIGAVGVEVVRRKYPEGLSRLSSSVWDAASKAKEAFVNGYKNATEAKGSVKTSA